MSVNRITSHPVIDIPARKEVEFSFDGTVLKGFEDEMIASALFANGIKVFGYHHKDHSPQGMFCANGQCSQCLVLVDGKPLKSCMTGLRANMKIQSLDGLPELPADDACPEMFDIPEQCVDVLVIGGGPAGLSAAVELGKLGIDTLIVDDKDRLGGKLVLQTHKFFGSVEDSHAGTRGFEIASILGEEVRRYSSVTISLNSTVVGVFSDGWVGVATAGKYAKVKPKKLLVATGARENMLSFPGNTLPGVFGAGAFQTLVNRDLVRCSNRVLIVGGGNVGLIAGYHAVQAGIEVVGIVEALSDVGGYKVHADKLKRLGVPIWARHTVVLADGKDRVESVTIAKVDDAFRVIEGTRRTFAVDTVLIAVGLHPVDEFYKKAKEWGMDVSAAGDAHEIAEASAAMFAGKIEGLRIARSLGRYGGEIPKEWDEKVMILKSRPGESVRRPYPEKNTGVVPIFHCSQKVPCNPCTFMCPEHIIRTENDDIMGLPFVTDVDACKGCLSCVAICPGLAVTIVDYRTDPQNPLVTLPYEIFRDRVQKDAKIPVTDVDGAILGYYPVMRVFENRKKYPGTLLVTVKMPFPAAKKAAGIWVQETVLDTPEAFEKEVLPDEAVICRCERVSAGEIRSAIRGGVRDMNQLKAMTRAGMGACGSKTCRTMIFRIFREEGIGQGHFTDRIDRPLFVEVPLGVLAGVREGGRNE